MSGPPPNDSTTLPQNTLPTLAPAPLAAARSGRRDAAAREMRLPAAQRFRAFRKLVMPARGPLASSLWWLRPGLLVLVVVIPLYLSFQTFDFDGFVPRRYIPSADYWWGLLLLLMLSFAALLGGAGPRRAPMQVEPIDVPSWLTAGLLLATCLGYVVWFGPLLAQPAEIFAIFTGERDNLRDVVSTTPGVTTLTQCGAAYAVLVAIKRNVGSTELQTWEKAGLTLVMLLALMRMFLWSERLAVLEVLLTYAVACAALRRFKTPARARWAAWAPLLAPGLLILAFTGTEYFRSWPFYRDVYSSIWAFAWDRLLAYYALASNSGIGLLTETSDWPRYTGRFVVEFLYGMPFIGHRLISALGNEQHRFEIFLDDYARAEFNNSTGIFTIVFDVGYIGSVIYFLLVGFLIGKAWRSWSMQRPLGLMFYPFCFLFLLELLRFNYLAGSRFVPIVGSFLFAWLAMQSGQRQHPRKRAAQANLMTSRTPQNWSRSPRAASRNIASD